MKKVKSYFIIIFTFIILVLLTNSSFATDVNYLVLKKSNTEHIVYIKDYLQNEFEFAFYNNSAVEEEKLDFISNAKDQADGYSVAYINEKSFEDYFKDDNKAFIFVKINNNIEKTLEINLLQEVVSEEDVEFVKNTTKRISTNTELLSTETKEENGIKYTTTAGKLTITDNETATYYYNLVEIPSTDEYNRFFELAEKINTATELEIIDNLQTTKEFVSLYNNLLPQDWNEVTEMIVNQPIDSENDDKYIVWLKKVEGNNVVNDVQFLIAKKEVNEEYVKDTHHEQHVTAQPTKEVTLLNGAIKLPVTYDSIALFIVLAILVVALIVVIILKKKSKKDENKN